MQGTPGNMHLAPPTIPRVAVLISGRWFDNATAAVLIRHQLEFLVRPNDADVFLVADAQADMPSGSCSSSRARSFETDAIRLFTNLGHRRRVHARLLKARRAEDEHPIIARADKSLINGRLGSSAPPRLRAYYLRLMWRWREQFRKVGEAERLRRDVMDADMSSRGQHPPASASQPSLPSSPSSSSAAATWSSAHAAHDIVIRTRLDLRLHKPIRVPHTHELIASSREVLLLGSDWATCRALRATTCGYQPTWCAMVSRFCSARDSERTTAADAARCRSTPMAPGVPCDGRASMPFQAPTVHTTR